jgi:hypothetical protein
VEHRDHVFRHAHLLSHRIVRASSSGLRIVRGSSSYKIQRRKKDRTLLAEMECVCDDTQALVLGQRFAFLII